MTLNNAIFDPVLKELYPNNSIERMLYEDNPLLGLIKKKQNFQGKVARFPVQYARSQNRSANFATAQGRSTTNRYEDWQLTMKRNYGFATVDNFTIESSKTNKGAFVEAISEATKGAIDGLARNHNIDLYRDGNGRVGQRGSVSGSILTLSQEQDITSFEVGQVLIASPNLDGSSSRAGSISVVKVDRDNGTFEFSDSITGFADDDYLFYEGDISSKLDGLQSWLPKIAPSSNLFYGVDRSIDTTRLGGVRFNGNQTSIRQTLFDASVRLDREGGKPDVVLMNSDYYAALLNELEGDSVYDKAEMKASTFSEQKYTISYSGVRIHGPRGPINVISDRDCPFGESYMLTLSTIELHSIGEPVRIFNTDGLPYLRQAADDGVELRCYSYSNLIVRDPGKNAVITLPSLVI